MQRKIKEVQGTMLPCNCLFLFLNKGGFYKGRGLTCRGWVVEVGQKGMVLLKRILSVYDTVQQKPVCKNLNFFKSGKIGSCIFR